MFDYPPATNERFVRGRTVPDERPEPDQLLEKIISFERDIRRGVGWSRFLATAAASQDDPPLPPVQVDALEEIALLVKPSVKELAGSLGLDPSTTSRIVTSLIDHGLVTRSVNPEDRRAARVLLSENGRRAQEAISQRRRNALASRVAGMSRDDLTALVRLLDAFVGHVDDRPQG